MASTAMGTETVVELSPASMVNVSSTAVKSAPAVAVPARVNARKVMSSTLVGSMLTTKSSDPSDSLAVTSATDIDTGAFRGTVKV